MADLSITEADVELATESGRIFAATFGETVLKGELVYQKAADNLYWKADADVLATAKVAGMALVGGAVNDVGVVIQQGNVMLGTILTAGVNYVLSSNAGKICSIADGNHASGDYITHIGTASTTSIMLLRLNATSITKP